MKGIEDKTIVVTGGAGFIGSHLVDALLAAGATGVAVVDTFFLGKMDNLAEAKASDGDAVRIYREDAGDRDAMAAVCDEMRPDIVFNLATKALKYSFFNPAGAYRVNTDIAESLAELLRADAYGRLVHVSSSEVYGTARYVPMDEDHPLLAETSYAAGKAGADLLLAAYVNMFGLDVTTVRPFNTYGPRQNEGQLAAVIPLTIRRLRGGEAPVIEGDGLQTRDFAYVADVVAAMLALATRDDARGRVINIASGRETTIRDIVEAICRALGYSGEIQFAPPRAADVRRHQGGIERARALIGEVAPTALDEGIERTVAWYLRDRDESRRDGRSEAAE